jgi:hypothetical protein
MDPNENLKNQLALAAQIEKESGHSDDVRDLVELIRVLDEWLNKGGFLPNRWRSAPVEPINGRLQKEK